MTYLELQHIIDILATDQPEILNQTVTILCDQSEEFFGVEDVIVTSNSDVLDDNHLVLKIPF